MTELRRRDLDPGIYPEEDALWDPQSRTFVPRRSGLFPLLVGLGLGLIIGAVITTAVLAAAPRSAEVGIPVPPPLAGAPQNVGANGSGEHKAGAAELPTLGYGEASPATESGAPLPAAEKPASSDVSVPAEIPATIGGTATWYCSASSACTRGYRPWDLVAAIDPTLGIPKGAWLRVHHGGRSVEVRVVDVCQCRGNRLIDLTSGAFVRLAPLSEGVIAVDIEELGASATAPATDLEGTP